MEKKKANELFKRMWFIDTEKIKEIAATREFNGFTVTDFLMDLEDKDYSDDELKGMIAYMWT